MKNWKTTLFGIGVLLTAIGTSLTALFDGDPETTLNFESIVAALAGLGLLVAKDGDK